MLTSLFLRFAHAGSEWVMWVLIALSFVSVALIVDRIIYFKKNAVNLDEMLVYLQQCLREGNLRAAWDLVVERESIECRVIAEGLKAFQSGSDACSEAMLSARARERGKVESHLNVLATI